MAKLKKAILGEPSGKLGNVVYKSRNGKPYISTLPVDPKVSQTEDAKWSRNRFSVLSPLNKAMAQDFFINTFWERSDINCENVRNKMMSVNSRLIGRDLDISVIKLIPGDELFDVNLQSFQWDESSLKFTVSPLNLIYSQIIHPEISAHGIIHLDERISESERQFLYITCSSWRLIFRKDIPLEFTINFSQDSIYSIKNYNYKKAYLMLVLINRYNEPAYGSKKIMIR